MKERVEAGVSELTRGIRETTNRVEAGTADVQRGIRETTSKVKADVARMTDRFGTYAKEEFWG